MFECLFSDTDTESEGEVEETSIQVEKITRLEAAQKKARIRAIHERRVAETASLDIITRSRNASSRPIKN